MSTPPDFGTAPIDQALGVATVDPPERIALLERLTPRITRPAKDTPTAAAKAYDPGLPVAAEERTDGPRATAQNAGALVLTLHRIATGKEPVPPRRHA
ncbi:hypothetical protein AB0M41_44510 [Streptomyces sp. NPDC051896]|uniref:hypothetical protein n=1 Tax=Streptomyces sp. NPDC051896 TaxID=3155416 RepID=UPI0034368096